MRVEPLNTPGGQTLVGPLLLTPQLFGDERGFFLESWNQRRWGELLAAHDQRAQPFVQDNHSRSSKGVLRGLHWQVPPHSQGKLVRCVAGEIFDVVVDLRRSSSTFGRWAGVHLSAENHQQLWVPVGFAHGFLALSSPADVLYKTTDFWSRAGERCLRWNDPQLAITWPLTGLAGAGPQLSTKDAMAPSLADLNRETELFS